MKVVRFSSLLTLALAVASGGCAAFCPAQPGSTCGWRFEMGRPSTLTSMTPTLLSQSSGPIGVQPLGILAGVSPGPIVANPEAVRGPVMSKEFAPMPQAKTMPPADPCTQEDLCQMLRELLRRTPARQQEE